MARILVGMALLTLASAPRTVLAALPTDLDGFLGTIFDTAECENFVGDPSYLSVATTECAPYTCDFPRQLCMREFSRMNDAAANQCRDIPSDCLTAANGGVPLGPPRRAVITTLPPSVFGGGPAARINGAGKPPVSIITGSPDGRSLLGAPQPPPPPPPPPFPGTSVHGDICNQGVPEGRFCGFKLQWTFNRETGNCEQFWFPGCKTESTNDNLFENETSCRLSTGHCTARPSTTTRAPRIRVPRPATTKAPPPPPEPEVTDYSGEIPAPPPEPVHRPSTGGVNLGSLASGFMGGGGGSGAGGLVGQFLGSGLGGGGGSRVNGGPSVPGYGGGSLGGSSLGGGNGGGHGGGGGNNFIGLIANAVKQVGEKRPTNGNAAQWLKNIDPQQISSLFSSFGR